MRLTTRSGAMTLGFERDEARRVVLLSAWATQSAVGIWVAKIVYTIVTPEAWVFGASLLTTVMRVSTSLTCEALTVAAKCFG